LHGVGISRPGRASITWEKGRFEICSFSRAELCSAEGHCRWKHGEMRLSSSRMRAHARVLRLAQTDAERKLWARLRSRQLCGAKFRRQHPIGKFVVDFCCIEHGLIVEVDGSQHAFQSKADERRTGILGRNGYRVLRFWDNEVIGDIEAVLQRIADVICNPHPDPLPRQGEG